MTRSREHGFSLIEVLIVLGLFAIALGTLPLVLITNARANALAHRVTFATGLAQDQIEVFRNMAWDEVASGQDTQTDPDDDMVYTRTWTVSDGITDQTSSVTVVVSWTDQTTRQVEIDVLLGA